MGNSHPYNNSSTESMGQMSLDELTRSLIMPGNMTSSTQNSVPDTPNTWDWVSGARQGPALSSTFPGLDINQNSFFAVQDQNADVQNLSGVTHGGQPQTGHNRSTPGRPIQGSGAVTPKNEERLAELRAKLLKSKERGATPVRNKKTEEKASSPASGTFPQPQTSLTQNRTGGNDNKGINGVSGNTTARVHSAGFIRPAQSPTESRPPFVDRRASSADIESLVAEHRPISPGTAPASGVDTLEIDVETNRLASDNQQTDRNISGHDDAEPQEINQSPGGSEQGEILDKKTPSISSANRGQRTTESLTPRNIISDQDQRKTHGPHDPSGLASSKTFERQSKESKHEETRQDSRRSSTSMSTIERIVRSSVGSAEMTKSAPLRRPSVGGESRRANQDIIKSNTRSHHLAESHTTQHTVDPRDYQDQHQTSTGNIEQVPHETKSTTTDDSNRPITINTHAQQIDRPAAAISHDVPQNVPNSVSDAMNKPEGGIQLSRDIIDWLEITDYHDRAYRDRLLKRYRRKQDLERERIALEEEERQEWQERLRIGRAVSVSTTHMPPPPLPAPARESTEDVGFQIKDMAKSTPDSSPTSVHPDQAQSSKRQHADSDAESTSRPAAKAPRLDSNGQFGGDTPMISPTVNGSGATDERIRKIEPQGNGHFRRSRSPDAHHANWTRSPPPKPAYRQHESYSSMAFRNREPSPDPRYGRYRTPEPYYRDDYNRPMRQERPLEDRIQRTNVPNNYRGHHSGGRSGYPNMGNRNGLVSKPTKALRLNVNDTRFFMIKSWNHENVQLAYEECTWTSQLKNLDLLSHAYTTTPNVILIFSVNNSKAFQGYARMASLPSPEIPTPSFSKPLIWESTDPFYLEWIAKNETGYGKVGHLKNPLNEGKPVFVGRDGQEIEREVGVELCAMLGMGGW